MAKKEFKLTELVLVGKELNVLLDPKPKIKTVAVKPANLIEAIKVAAELLEDGDMLTEATHGVLVDMEVELPAGIVVNDEAEDEGAEDEETEISLEDLISLAREMNDIMKLAPAIDVKEGDFDVLKAAVMENCYDDAGCQIYETDEFTASSWATLKTLGIIPVNEDGVSQPTSPAPKEEKKGKGNKKEKTEKPAKKEKAPKKGKAENAPKGPGVIKSIVAAIKDDGPITKEEILDKLVKLFPDRDAEAMKKTINVQVPNRINKEQDFTIENSDKGWKVAKAAKK